MSVEQLITTHLDIWTAADTEKKSGRGRNSGNAGSVYGIKKLRELILELAVRGKLVPQDESDEPASEHLQNINRELCSSINVPSLSLLRRDKSTIDPEDFHFTLPNSWLWCELQNIAIFENGKAHEQYVVEKEKFVLVNSSYISSNGGKIKYVSNRLSPLSKDDIAIVMSDVPSGRALVRCFLVTDSDNFTLNQRIGALKTGSTLSKHYLLMVLDRNKYYLQYDDGKKQSNLKKIQILSCPIPLPPLAEQHRIVAKVDELMALCDQLENQHNDAAEAHEKLVTHLLGTLTQSQNAEDFSTHWQRISEHFDTLFTTEASIDALKQSILELAVMGKISCSQQNDTPIAKLLKALMHEKKLLRISKKDEDTLASELSTALDSIENNRVILKTRSFCDFITKGTTPSKNDLLTEGDIPFLKVYNIVNNQLDFDYRPTFISNEIHQSKLNRSKIYPTDVIMNIVGPPLGKVAIIPNQHPEWNMNQALAAFRPLAGIYNRYVFY